MTESNETSTSPQKKMTNSTITNTNPTKVVRGGEGSYNQPNFWEDLQRVRPSDLMNVLSIPCSRTSFLYGVAGGLGIGLLHFGIRGRFLLKQSTILSSCHRAVGGFVFISLITWEKCRYDRARAENNIRLVTQQLKRLSEAKAKKDAAEDPTVNTNPDANPKPSSSTSES